MPSPRDSTLFAGLCASLMVHGIVAYLATDVYIRQLQSRIAQPPLDRQALLAAAVRSPNDFALGEATGSGTAIAPMQADLPQLAPDATQDQPFASLDPTGPAPIGVDPSPAVLQGDAPQSSAPPTFGVAADTAPVAPKSPPSQQRPVPTPAPPDVEPTPDGALAAATAQPAPQVDVTAAQATPAPPAERPQTTAGAPAPPADAAPQTDSEIDAFSKAGVAEFRPGRTDVQFGRKAKLTRPRVLIAGQIDLIGAANPRVVLQIHTGVTGKVTDVSIAQSSGSDNIDGPVRLAAYDWWFEPPLGRDGKPRSSEFLFTVSIVGG